MKSLGWIIDTGRGREERPPAGPSGEIVVAALLGVPSPVKVDAGDVML